MQKTGVSIALIVVYATFMVGGFLTSVWAYHTAKKNGKQSWADVAVYVGASMMLVANFAFLAVMFSYFKCSLAR